MFAKLAHFGHFGRTHGAGFAARPSNDNHPLRLVVASRRPRRSILACHWHRTPSGTLECVWSVGRCAKAANMSAERVAAASVARGIGDLRRGFVT
jgi:hypothetical protein